MKISSYIPISRKLFESWLWLEKREFSHAEAWVDLLRRVRFEANSTKRLIQGKMVEIHRGEIPASLRLMAEWWGWSKNRVDKFLILLEREGMIKKRTANGTAQTVITICNYDRYNFTFEKTGQQTGQGRDSDGTGSGQGRDNTNKENKENKEKKEEEFSSENSLSGCKQPDAPAPPLPPPDSCESNVPSERIDYEKLVGWFNEKTGGAFGVIKTPLGENRKKMLRARIAEHGKASFVEVVENAMRSGFLRGQNQRGWTATFDWLIKPANYEKVLSKNYNNAENGANRGAGQRAGARTTDEELLSAIAQGIARAERNKAQQ